MDYNFYGITVAESVMDRVVETALRLKINLVIPASFLDIDNPPEKALADCVARRGIFLSQHHIEPLGLSHFTFENYCKKFQKDGQYSYIHNPETLIEGWKYYAEKSLCSCSFGCYCSACMCEYDLVCVRRHFSRHHGKL